MTGPAQLPPSTKRPPRRWLRRIGWTLLGLLLGFAIFHRPLLRGLIHVVAVKVAAKQNIQLSFKVGGTVLTNLSLENIHAVPTGTGTSPVEKIDIEAVRVRYNLINLVRSGVSEVLQSYELRNAYIAVQPVEGTKSQKRDLGKTLSGMLQQPALFSDRVDVRNLNLVAHVPDGEFAIKGVSLFLDPVKPGILEIERIQIPKVKTWKNIHATTVYPGRDLVISGLKLDDDLQFEFIELDASARAQKINRLYVRGTFFGGLTDLATYSHESGKNKAEFSIWTKSSGVSIERAARYLNPTASASGQVGDFSFVAGGDPYVPSSWDIRALGVVEGIGAGTAKVDQVSTKFTAHKGAADFAADVVRGGNHVNIAASAHLPDDVNALVRTEFDGTLKVSAPTPGEIVPNVVGTVTADGQFGLHQRKLTVALDVSVKDAGVEKFNVGMAGGKIEITKLLPEPPPKNQRDNETPSDKKVREHEEDKKQPATITDGLQSRIALTFENVKAAAFAVDGGAVTISSDGARVALENLEVKRAQNVVSASGTFEIPPDMREIANAPFQAEFAVTAPSVNAYFAEPDLNAPNARVEASGKVRHDATGYDGHVSVNATELAMRDFRAEKLTLEIGLAGQTATVETLSFALNETDGVNGSGKVELREPYAYEAQLAANLRDLSRFDAFVPNIKDGLGGAVTLNWSGHGEAQTIRHSGDVNLAVTNAKAGDAVGQINAQIAGKYSPEEIDLPTFWVTTNKGDLSATISLREQLLAVRSIAVSQNKVKLLTGEFSFPLDLRTPQNRESLVPKDGPIAAALETSDIKLETLFPKDKAPARGNAKVTITASGTINVPQANLHLDARDLQAKAAPKLAPASVSLDTTLFDNKLALQGKIQQPAISPIEIAGTLPLPVREIIAKGKIDEASEVQLSVRLPQSSVGFLTQVVPILRYVEGKMSASVDLAGTIAQPELSGAVLLDMPAIRFAKQDLPAISNFRGDVRFAGNQLTVNRLGGDISGGPFNLTGTIQLAKLNEPVFDLKLTSKAALLVRNETLTVRADSDIQIVGPLAAGTVKGNVWLTRSRFFREIEILPIQLPGRPAPKPPSTTTGFSFDKPPLRDWKFDVTIKTKDQDPFLVRGNLANGQVFVDLALVGTGKSPALDGTLTIQNFVASLPFSKLEVNDSYVYFTPDNPFVPTLDIHGTSSMRDNNINVYIYGTANDPQTLLTAEPPLPQEDIISLLATGTTASELTGAGGGGVLAGRALILATQRLSRMIFKKKPPADTGKESMFSRFNIDVGGVDPKTGQQEVNGSFKLAEKFYLIGDLDVGGNVRVKLKYLLRFK